MFFISSLFKYITESEKSQYYMTVFLVYMYFFHWRIQRRITKRSQRDGKPFTVLLISTFCWIAHILHNISLYSVSSKIARQKYSPIHHLCCSKAAARRPTDCRWQFLSRIPLFVCRWYTGSVLQEVSRFFFLRERGGFFWKYTVPKFNTFAVSVHASALIVIYRFCRPWPSKKY